MLILKLFLIISWLGLILKFHFSAAWMEDASEWKCPLADLDAVEVAEEEDVDHQAEEVVMAAVEAVAEEAADEGQGMLYYCGM